MLADSRLGACRSGAATRSTLQSCPGTGRRGDRNEASFERTSRPIHHSPIFWIGVVLCLAAVAIIFGPTTSRWRPAPKPGRMVGRFTLRDDRTLFLFVFAADGDPLPSTLEQQKAMLHGKYAAGRWECPSIMAELDRATELYLDRVSQIRMRSWSKGRVALIGDAAFCVSLLAGQGSALAMISAYVLAGELAEAGGRYQQAFDNYEARLRPFIETKQRGAERLRRRLCTEDPMGPRFSQSSDKGICDSADWQGLPSAGRSSTPYGFPNMIFGRFSTIEQCP